jgi:ketosteroid isomerase-like protein
MPESGVEVVQSLFDRFAEGGIEAALDVLDEHVVIEIPPSMSAEPDSYHGHEGARHYFAGFNGMLENLTYEPLELIPEGGRVLARVRLSGRGVSSGLEVDLESVVVHELENGKITRMAARPDLDSARAG